MDRVFVDTSAWYVLADAKDPDHASATAFMASNTLPLLTSTYVLDETLTLIKSRLGNLLAVQFGEKLRASRICSIVHVSTDDEEAAWLVFKQYNDKAWSFTDCTSLVVMKRTQTSIAFTLDAHFAQMGFQSVP